ncbi:hypothetical protein ACS0TY_003030 [Phlomoides rotata]
MGRDFTGFRTDKKSNTVDDKSNGVIRVAPKALPEKSEIRDCEIKDHNLIARIPDECNEKQDVLGVKSTNHQPEEKIIKAEDQKSTDKKVIMPAKPASGSAVNGTIDANSFESNKSGLEDDKQNAHADHANGAGNNDSEILPKSSDLHSPMSVKKSQPNSPLLSRKQLMPHCKSYYDEEDNWSMASSTATSVRTRITVPVAPKFTCDNRLERRKQFYTKLDEKHKALEKEKIEYQARNKEEEQAAIRQMRKSMTYKANPVPNFYREGPPPKVELKKLPVTRAKSPNLTRRKSCGDAVKPSPEDKGLCGRAARHSVGVYAQGKASPLQKKLSPITPKSKNQSDVRKSNGSSMIKNRPQQSKAATPIKELGNGDIHIES